MLFTHDSLAMGEDGPTHQPVEQLAGLRSIPGMVVVRPADANETVAAWRIAIDRDAPVTLVLTRQGLPVLALATYAHLPAGVRLGGYVLADFPPDVRQEIILIATGSEVHLALAARDQLTLEGVGARAVSLPSTEIFAEQSVEYRDTVLLPGVDLLAIEAGVSLGWRSYVGPQIAVIAVDTFGASAPWKRRDGALRLQRHQCLQKGPRRDCARATIMMRVGIAADHGGFGLKAQLSEALRADEYAVADFGAHELNPNDDHPDFVIPLAKAVAAREVERGIALRGSGVGACIAANKIPGVRAGLIHDVFSAHQGVEDYEMNVFCLGGKVIGSALALELIERFLCAVQRCTTPQATYCKSPGVGGARFRVRSTLSVRDRRRTVRNLNEAIISPGPKNEARCPC